MTKIREFKGSLKPIFNKSETEELKTEQDIIFKEEILKNYLPINQIKPRNDQPRKIFDETSLEELSQSIQLKGVIQPIIVSQINNGFYEIVVGERRWRAAKRVGLKEIPAIIKEYDTPGKMTVALIENIQRENLNPLEEALAMQSLINECSMTHNQVAESIGKSRATVSNLLRLLNLENEVKAMIYSGALETGHAKVLLSLSEKQQIEIAKLVVSKKLSVRETENLVQRLSNKLQKQKIFIPLEFERKAKKWKTSLPKQISSKVNVHFGPSGKGRLVIHFDSVEEADWLLDHIKVDESHQVQKVN